VGNDRLAFPCTDCSMLHTESGKGVREGALRAFFLDGVVVFK
jgi:hypothetical protein